MSQSKSTAQKSTALGRRYGRALLELADEAKLREKIGKELESLQGAWDTSGELREVFVNPSVDAEVRKKIIVALSEKLGLHTFVVNTLKLLADRQRIEHLPEVIAAYLEIANAAEGRVVAEVITAKPMPASYYAKLEKVLEEATGSKVTIERSEDPSLIGGVVTRVGDLVFDGSLRTRLNELKETMLSQ